MTTRWLMVLATLAITGACESPTLDPGPDVAGQSGAGWRSSSDGASSASWGMASGVAGAGGLAMGGAVSAGGRSSSRSATGGEGKASSGGQMSTGGQVIAGSTAGTGGAMGSGGVAASGGATGQGGSASGASGAGGASTTGGTTAGAFNWGNTAYDPAGGSGVTHQSHNVGKPCLAACHSHPFKFAGTVYQSDGTTAAANAQIGLMINGNLVATYSGSKGNFFGDLSGTVDWATAQIAIRSAAGTSVMSANAAASGNCNSCHTGTGTKRIIVP